MSLNLSDGQRAERKTFITVAEWTTGSGTSAVTHKEVLGRRVEDSSIEFNPDIATSTDILGITYTDVNKTEPQQSFDTFYIMGGSDLAEYLVENALENKISAYNNVFNIYLIMGFIPQTGTSGTTTISGYKAVKHTGCSIIPQSIGGDSYTQMPIEAHFSNKITTGMVDKLDDTFQFIADQTV